MSIDVSVVVLVVVVLLFNFSYPLLYCCILSSLINITCVKKLKIINI